MKWLPIVVTVIACTPQRQARLVPSPRPPERPLAVLAAAVGEHPRVVAELDLRQPQVRKQLIEVEPVLPALIGTSLADCNLTLDGLLRIRVAIGEPLRIAAEVDGDIDTKRLQCLLGDALVSAMSSAEVVVRDRRGGIAIERNRASQQGDVSPALLDLCVGSTCIASVLGPRGRDVWIALSFGERSRMRFGGAKFDSADAVIAAFNSLRSNNPSLDEILLRREGRDLIAEVSGSLSPASNELIKQQLIEMLRIPSSSMVPTLRQGDNIYVAKGPLQGPIVAGDVLVHRDGDRLFVKRVVATAGQTVVETAAGIEIGGIPLATKVLDDHFLFNEIDEGDLPRTVRGKLVREYIGKRSYLTVRTGPPRPGLGSWSVPSAHLFLLGDNRNNSNDSRYAGPVAEKDVVGRVIGIWLATRDGVPDWNRMGTPIE